MIKSRIAPTPSGYLHRGNAFNFLLTDTLVKRKHGKLLLRIDDMDRGRIRTAYLKHIFSTLQQLGIRYQDGPRSIEELETKWSQRHRMENYAKTLGRLRETGLVYACDCSRKQVAENSTDGLYNGRCRTRHLPLDQENVAWRIDTREIDPVVWMEGTEKKIVDLAQRMGDFVIRKKDGKPAYQICSLTDDITFAITLIVRGEDLLESSAAQLWLAGLIEERQWLHDLELHHHPLLVDQTGEKLSKSAGAEAISAGGRAMSHTELNELKLMVDNYLVADGL